MVYNLQCIYYIQYTFINVKVMFYHKVNVSNLSIIRLDTYIPGFCTESLKIDFLVSVTKSFALATESIFTETKFK